MASSGRTRKHTELTNTRFVLFLFNQSDICLKLQIMHFFVFVHIPTTVSWVSAYFWNFLSPSIIQVNKYLTINQAGWEYSAHHCYPIFLTPLLKQHWQINIRDNLVFSWFFQIFSRIMYSCTYFPPPCCKWVNTLGITSVTSRVWKRSNVFSAHTARGGCLIVSPVTTAACPPPHTHTHPHIYTKSRLYIVIKLVMPRALVPSKISKTSSQQEVKCGGIWKCGWQSAPQCQLVAPRCF